MSHFEAEACHLATRQRLGGGEEGHPNTAPVLRPPCWLVSLPFGRAITGASLRQVKPLLQ